MTRPWLWLCRLAHIPLLASQCHLVHALPTQTNATVTPLVLRHTLADGAPIPGPRPFYAIAHRVLTIQGVKDALNNGANAIEMDLTAWSKGWWADHDGLPTSAGDKAEDMFKAIAEQRRGGNNIVWVWLDIKNPDYCNEDDTKWKHCSVARLRELARTTLLPQGVRVLYGFYKANSKAYRTTRDGLHEGEAINLNGKSQDVAREFQANGPVERPRRVYSYGYFNLPFQFGDCTEPNFYTCTELRQGVQTGAFGQVYGWTLAKNQAEYADKLMSHGVDGLIYGFKATYYYNHADTRAAAKQITDWLDNNRDKRYLARRDDFPW